MLLAVLFATGLPIEVLMIPAFSLFVRENLVRLIPATIVFLATTSLPFSIWLLKNFIDQIPIEIEEAAQIDGAGPFERIRRHVIPLAAAGIAVSALFSFMNAWGQFIIPFVLLQSPSHAPASVAIYQFLTAFGRVQYGPWQPSRSSSRFRWSRCTSPSAGTSAGALASVAASKDDVGRPPIEGLQ